MAERPLANRLRLVVVTDSDVAPGRTLLDVVRAALRGGAPAIQLRAKTEPTRATFVLAQTLLAETRAAGALLFVNDRVDVALAAGADGAHLGDDDLPLTAARGIAPPGFLLGRSVLTAEQATQAVKDGADYVGLGPVFPTPSKPDAGDPVWVERVATVTTAVEIPTIGIGGIDAGNARAVATAGAAGIAVIRAVMQAADPERATRELLREVSAGQIREVA